MPEAYICDYVRTPFGRYAGALSSIRTDDLAAIPLRELQARNPDCDWQQLDDVILGCANQAGEDNRNVARMAALLSGLPISAGGVTLNRLCGSGMDAILAASRAIKSGEGDLFIAGGVESMSRAPFVLSKSDTPFSRSTEMFDTTIGWRFINRRFKQQFGVDSMPETAENLAEIHGISRQDQDLFAVRSQQRAEAARAAGILAQEIVPVSISGKKGESTSVTADEQPRPDTTFELLSGLGTPFRQPGTVTAGNSSGVNDGAAALLIASGKSVKALGLVPRARILGGAVAGVEPRIMGLGPVPAIGRLCQRTGVGLDQFDVIELNEAFAAQALAVTRSLGLADDDERLNPNGGAIAIGHPLGASGARIVGCAMLEMQRRKGRYALASMCIGVGQGIAMALEIC